VLQNETKQPATYRLTTKSARPEACSVRSTIQQQGVCSPEAHR